MQNQTQGIERTSKLQVTQTPLPTTVASARLPQIIPVATRWSQRSFRTNRWKRKSQLGSQMGGLSMCVQARYGWYLHYSPTQRWWGQILLMGRALDGAPGHPFRVESWVAQVAHGLVCSSDNLTPDRLYYRTHFGRWFSWTQQCTYPSTQEFQF